MVRLLKRGWKDCYGTRFVPAGEDVNAGVVCQVFEAWEKPESEDDIDPDFPQSLRRPDGFVVTWTGEVPMQCVSRSAVESLYRLER